MAGEKSPREIATATGRPLSTVRGWRAVARAVAPAATVAAVQMGVKHVGDSARVWPGAVGGLKGMIAAFGALDAETARDWRQEAAGWLVMAAAVCRCRVFEVKRRKLHEPALVQVKSVGPELFLGPDWVRGPPLGG